MRAAIASAVLGLGLLAAPAQATPILLYKELVQFSLSNFITDLDGKRHVQTVTGKDQPLLGSTSRSGIGISDKCTHGGAGYYKNFGPTIWFQLVTEWDFLEGACGEEQGVLDYGISGTLTYDLTFRPNEQHSIYLDYFPVGGVVSMLLQDVKTGLIVFQRDSIRDFSHVFEFTDDHVYRLLATSRVQTKYGDPYGDFGLDFRDKLTGEPLEYESAPPVPEPTSMLLLTTGLGALALRRKQKRSKEV